MATDSGFSNQKKKGIAQYETIEHLGSSKYGKAVIPKSVFEKLAASPIVSVSDVIGSNGQVEFWNIELTAHTALVGDVLRIEDSTLLNFEFDIIQVIDVDNFRILPISDVKPVAAMSASIFGWVSQRVDSTGAVISSAAPIKFVLDGVDTEVLEDTVIPANSIPLPTKLLGVTVDTNGNSNKGELHVRDDDLNSTATLIDGKLPSGLTVVVDELKVAATGTVGVSSLPVSMDIGNSDSTTQRVVIANNQPTIPVDVKSALIGVPYDQVVLTYVGATTDIATVVAKQSGVTVATLTLTYDGSNRLVDVTRT